MTPETAQTISDMMNSPAVSATVGLVLVALGTAALVIIKRGQKTEADVTAARVALISNMSNCKKTIEELREKVRLLGVEKFILSMQVKNRDQVIREQQQQIANLKKANEQLARAQDERRNGQ